MSQIIGFLGNEFALIASDSNIADDNGRSIFIRKKLFRGDDFIITSVGVSFGINIIEGLIERSKSLGISDIEGIREYLLTYGSNQYEHFKKNYKENLKEELKRLYFLFSAVNENNEIAIGFIGSEGDERLKVIPVCNIITAPRRIVLENRLLNLTNKTELEIVDYITNYLNAISQKDSSLKSPFTIAIIDKNRTVKYF